jgi:hypothetical protein
MLMTNLKDSDKRIRFHSQVHRSLFKDIYDNLFDNVYLFSKDPELWKPDNYRELAYRNQHVIVK